jgi:hypothetical protein
LPETFFHVGLEGKKVENDMISKVIIYKVFCMNYDLKKGELLGVLTERRNDLRGKTRLESAARWAKLMFGQLVRDKHTIFVVPDELNFKNNTTMLMEKMVFNKEEFCERGKSSHYDFFSCSPSKRLIN